MNIPEIYLVEPYNAYAPKGRKKHWHEIVEEQALLQRIIAEQQALQEAQNKTLPPNSPNISVQTVGNMAGGAGGIPVWDFYNPSGDIIDFSATPLAGAGPMTVVFTNLTTTPQFDQYLWLFGDGTTSTDINPTHVYQSSSVLITASLQVSSSQGPAGGIKIKNGYLSASVPLVIASGSYITSSGPGPISASFTNLTVNTSQTPTTLYKLFYGDGASSSFAISGTIPSTPVIHNYANTGSFTASVQATGSYGIASAYTASFYVPAPTLTALFGITTGSNCAPTTVVFTNSTAYNGVGGGSNLTYHWELGSGSLTASTIIPVGSIAYTAVGPYTASLAVTESLYGIKSYYTRSWRLELPTLSFELSSTIQYATSPTFVTLNQKNLVYTGTGTYYGGGGRYYSGEFSEAGVEQTQAWAGNSATFTYYTRSIEGSMSGSFTASMQLTESTFGVAYMATCSFYIPAPTVTAAFTTQSAGNGGTTDSYMEPVSMSFTSSTAYTGHGTLTYLWDFGSSSFSSSVYGSVAGTASTAGPHFRSDYSSQGGGYTASLQVTESSYGLKSKASKMFYIGT